MRKEQRYFFESSNDPGLFCPNDCTAGNIRYYCRGCYIPEGSVFLNEAGGLQFLTWGMTFQKKGADGLLKVLPPSARQERTKLAEFVSLCSRKLDLLQTALGCLDDLAAKVCEVLKN